MTYIASVRKGQTDMPYKGEHQTHIKQSMRYHIFPGEAYRTILQHAAESHCYCNLTTWG